MSKNQYRVRNWSQYNKSLVSRGSLRHMYAAKVKNNLLPQRYGRSDNPRQYFLAGSKALSALPVQAWDKLFKGGKRALRYQIVNDYERTVDPGYESANSRFIPG